MDQRTWDAIDAIAEQEADALRRAREYRLRQPRKGAQGLMSRDQAIWDEGLEEHFIRCSFCGRTLRGPQEDPEGPGPRPGHRVSLQTQDADICDQCMYVYNRMHRSPVRSVPE